MAKINSDLHGNAPDTADVALLLTGIATNICVLFTANEAYMRDFRLVVPTDGSAAETKEEHENALSQMRKLLKAETPTTEELDFRRYLSQ